VEKLQIITGRSFIIVSFKNKPKMGCQGFVKISPHHNFVLYSVGNVRELVYYRKVELSS